MNDLLRRVRLVSAAVTPAGLNGPVDFNSTGDKFIYTPVTTAHVYRFGFITNTAQDPDANGFVLSLGHRITAGTDTGRVERATITRADADITAAGRCVYADVLINVAETTAIDGSKFNVDPAGPLTAIPGQEIVISVTNANGAASTGYVFLEVMELAFEKAATTNIRVTV